MSIRLMSAVWQSAPFKGGELLVLLALADFANDDGYAYPSEVTLARKARLSDRQVRRTLTVLRESAWLEVIPHAGPAVAGNGGYRVNLFRVTPQSPDILSEAGHFVQETGHLLQEAGHFVQETGHPCPGEPSLDPSVEPPLDPPTPSSRPRARKAQAIDEEIMPLTEDERAKLIAKWSAKGLDEIDSRLALAAAHPNAQKYPKNQHAYCDNWLRREHAWAQGNRSNGNGNGNGRNGNRGVSNGAHGGAPTGVRAKFAHLDG